MQAGRFRTFRLGLRGLGGWRGFVYAVRPDSGRAASHLIAHLNPNAVSGQTDRSFGVYAGRVPTVQTDLLTYYLPEHSEPEAGRYVFGYAVRLGNQGDLAVRVLTRAWTLTDSLGRAQTLRGTGVAGERPLILPGGRFEYSSVCILTTPSGFLEGVFELVDEAQTPFTATVARTALEPGGSSSRDAKA